MVVEEKVLEATFFGLVPVADVACWGPVWAKGPSWWTVRTDCPSVWPGRVSISRVNGPFRLWRGRAPIFEYKGK